MSIYSDRSARARRNPLVLGLVALLAISLAAAAGGPAASAPGERAPADGTVPVQFLALNDLHGNLEPVDGPAGAVTRRTETGDLEQSQAGGVAQLATLVKRAKEGQPNSLTVGAGDIIGGSPLLSANFHDEPTVDAMEQLGLDVASVGNHEFDEGPDELLRIVKGGCHPEDGCAVPAKPYDGTAFPYLAANVTRKGSEKPLLPPYWIKTLPGGERIGFIGLITRHAPDSISASRIKDVEFHDETATIARYAHELDRLGVKAQAVLIHEGGAHNGVKPYNEDCDAQGPAAGLQEPIKDIARKAAPEVDLIISGHSHEPYVCSVPDPAGRPRIVTQAASFGRTFTDVRFGLDPRTKDVDRDSVHAVNRPVDTATPQDPDMARLIATWRERSADLENKPVGYITGDLPGRGSTAPERPLGDVIADAQAEATRGDRAQLALVQPGAIRADITYKAAGKEGDGVVTYAEAFRAAPFETPLVTMTLTGKQLVTALRQGFSGGNETSPRFLQPSAALRYSVDLSRSGADRLLADSVRVAGQPVRDGDNYRVTVNEFLSDGGDGFRVLKDGTDRDSGTTDTASLVDHLLNHSSPEHPLDPPKAERITVRD
ncbi:bifunctional metallophosphatase/5'-nucleotidase [Streptomyces violens]|uniref:bifunctional metallophosphatase/5'-nucleotidase n=1 Tax=Streptomyces violens TaxID=66377 RepID=UPI0004BE4E07|nr:bifunctional metallophosphatase/5'-nucleotidase [Streptomyces violens]